MKKIVSFILSLVMVFQTVILVNAKNREDDFDKILLTLVRAGIVTLNSEGNFSDNETVSRGKFSEMVGKAINVMQDYGMQYFTDVPKEHDQAYFINPLTDLGIISFNDAKIFEPDRPIRYSEGCKMLLCAMGYSQYALLNGAPMDTWVRVASEAEVATDVLNPDAISEREACILIYNAMKAPVMRENAGQWQVDKEANLFAEHKKIYFSDGVVGATDKAYLETASLQRQGMAIVGGEEVATEVDLTKYLGARIEYVYTYNSKNDDKTIFYANIYDEEDILTINGDLFKEYDYSKNTISYYKDEISSKTETENIEKNMQIIYNGVPYRGTVTSATDGFSEKTRRGYITFVDSDGNGSFDILNIKNYEVFPSATIDTVNESIYGGFEKSTIDYKDFDSVTLYDSEGKQKELISATEAILNVARSANDEVLEIILCSENKEIEVSSVLADENKITGADGTSYKVDTRVMQENEKTLISYKSAKVYFDAFGYIVKIEKGTSGGYKVGYMISGRGYEEDSGSYTVNLKTYTQDKKIVDLKLVEKVKIDEISYNLGKNPDTALKAFPKYTKHDTYYTIAPQIIRYKTDNNGLIVAVDTVNRSENEDKLNSLRVRHEADSVLYATRLGLDTYYTASETAMFTAPDLNENGEMSKNGAWVEPTERDFDTSLSMSSDSSYKIKTYNYSNDSLYTDVVLLVRNMETLVKEAYIFKGTSKVYNEAEGEALTAINCIQSGAEASLLLNPGVEAQISKLNLEFGDMFFVNTDSAGRATSIKKIFDAGDLKFNNSGNDYWYYGTYSPYSNWSYRTGEDNRNQLSKMWVYQKRGDAIFGTYEFADLQNDDYNEIMRVGSVPVVIVDRENKTVEKSNFNGILSYEEAGDSASLILLESRIQSAKSVIIYK